MYNFILNGITNKNEYEELIKVFLNPSDFQIFSYGEDKSKDESKDESKDDSSIDFTFDFQGNKNLLKHQIYNLLKDITGKQPDWGVLTGVRPVKLAGELISEHGEREAKRLLLEDYCLTEQKADLILEIYKYQQTLLPKSNHNSVGIYIGIPFCPTRCVYCSFTSNQVAESEILRYMKALHTEIDFVADEMKRHGRTAESIYIGGGTPTTLNDTLLKELLSHVNDAFLTSGLKEFTVEAGRPDTITEEKLEIISNAGAGRISINPQSMKKRTLELIGRAHAPEDIITAFSIAKKHKIPVINTDIIAGLPEETPEDFAHTLNNMVEIGAENITVHTLAVKRASKLIDIDKDFHYKQGETVRQMLEEARRILSESGFRPYYLYRQKHMAGSFENVGYCKEHSAGIYNIRIMEEKQTIIALGAGGISKIYFPEENRLERIPNVSNYELYIERIAEMLERKKDKLFI